MNDGSIRIGTKIDLSNIKEEVKALEKELKAVQKEADKLTAKEEKVKETFSAEREIDSMVIDKRDSHADDINEREAEALSKINAEREQLNAKMQEYNAMLEQANAKLQQQSAIQKASKELDSAVKSEAILDKISTQEEYNSLLEQTMAKMAAIEAMAERIATANGVSKDAILAANPAYQKLSDTMSVLENTTRKFATEAEVAGEKAQTGIRKAKTETNGFSTALLGAIKKIGKLSLAIFGIRGAYRAVRMAVTEYLATNEHLKAQIETMKSLFAQVLGPAIEFVVNMLIKGISAVNGFVHALTGVNIVAKANEAALKKVAKASQQIAGFDEQTKLSGGDTSSYGKLPDGTNMDLSFLAPFMEAVQKFKKDITPLIQTVGDFFSWLWKEVLVPFAEWLMNGALSGALNILGGAFLALNDALLIVKPLFQWLWDNILAPIEKWTGGVIVDVLNGIGNWIHEHHETLGKVAVVLGAIFGVIFGLPALISGIGAALGALGAVFGAIFSPIGLLVAAITGLVVLFVTLYDECEGFRKGMDQVWEGIKGIFQGAIDFIEALFQGDWAGMDAAWEKIKDSAKYLWEGLVEGLKAGWEWCKEKIVAIWNKIADKFKEIFGIHSPSTVFAGFGKDMMDGLFNGIKNSTNKVIRACRRIWSAIKSVFSSVGSWFKDTFSKAWQSVKDIFSTGGKIFDGIKDGIASTFKTIVNGLIDGINKIIATPFSEINKMLNTIRGIEVLGVSPFKGLWNYNPLPVPQIPKLARGAIVNNPGRGVPAIIGEAGAEAVLPLENNTEWMDILAEKIGGNVTIPIYMDGKKIATYVVDIQKKKAFAMNGV